MVHFKGVPHLVSKSRFMSDMPKWELIRSEPVDDLKLFRARFDYMKNPRNGLSQRMVVLESSDAANIVAITKDEQMIFVKQYRVGIHAETLELPGGIVDPGEDHTTAAQRELREETGYTGGTWSYLGKIASNPVFMNNYTHHYFTENVMLTDTLKLDEGEAVDVVTMPIVEVFQRWRQGDFDHPHTVNALLLFFAQRQMI